MNKLKVTDLDVSGKRVLVRVDFNVPLKDGTVESDKRLRASLPTVQHLIKNGARVILMSHLGRPKGKPVDSMRMSPVGDAFGKLLGQSVKTLSVCVGDEAKKAAESLKNGEVLLLENLRFHPEEEGNDPGFSKQLASLGELYVNDAFGTAHRAHASTEGITHFVQKSAAGFLMQKELDYLGGAIQNPARPFVAILGGSKVSSKIDVIKSLLPQVDHLIIGGGMAYTFYKAQGLEIGKSLCEDDKVQVAKDLLASAGNKLMLPVDCVISDAFDFDARKVGTLKTVKANEIPAGWIGLDAGPATVQKYTEVLSTAKTVLWNGPLGVFEIAETAVATFKIAEALASATKNGAITIIGGGDSAAAIEKARLEDRVSHVSTGGGASLEFLEGKELPGVTALSSK
ncbi:MAG: phosphoglycerate kinase [Leptospirales bacterium]|nr:phosphoglycerate kinase [Leptospirales bacterium]